MRNNGKALLLAVSKDDYMTTSAKEITGWNGTLLRVGSKAKCHQAGMKRCYATIEALTQTHADISITKGNKTWNAGDKATVGVWWMEACK